MALQVEDELTVVGPDRTELLRSWLRYVWVVDGLPGDDVGPSGRWPVPVLEIGPTHVAAATVDLATDRIASGPVRSRLAPGASAAEVLDAAGRTALALGRTLGQWGVVLPGPTGDRPSTDATPTRLTGVDVAGELAGRLDASSVVLLEDVDAFTLGEHVAGAAPGVERVVGLVLGAGVGMSWIRDGRPRSAGPDEPLPPGSVGDELDVLVSERTLQEDYARRTGQQVAGVVALADAGDRVAARVVNRAFRGLGRALRPALRAFGAEVVVLGGGPNRASARVRDALASTCSTQVVLARRQHDAPFFGGAWWVVEEALPPRDLEHRYGSPDDTVDD